MKTILCIVIGMILSACATGPKFTEAPAPPADSGLVYVYRLPSLVASVYDARFYVDGTRVAALSPDGYTYFAVKPGAHAFTQDWPILMMTAWGRQLRVPLSVRPGETHYFRFQIGSNYAGYGVQIQWILTEVDPDIGRREITDRHFQQPETNVVVGN